MYFPWYELRRFSSNGLETKLVQKKEPFKMNKILISFELRVTSF